MRTEEPRAIRLKDYRPPDYRVREIALDFALHPEATRVKSRMVVERLADGPVPLVLNGERLKLVAITLDGRSVQILGTRFIPATPAGYTHTVTSDERLDVIATRYYRDPLRFWLIADANGEMDPEELLQPGRGILIPPNVR